MAQNHSFSIKFYTPPQSAKTIFYANLQLKCSALYGISARQLQLESLRERNAFTAVTQYRKKLSFTTQISTLGSKTVCNTRNSFEYILVSKYEFSAHTNTKLLLIFHKIFMGNALNRNSQITKIACFKSFLTHI